MNVELLFADNLTVDVVVCPPFVATNVRSIYWKFWCIKTSWSCKTGILCTWWTKKKKLGKFLQRRGTSKCTEVPSLKDCWETVEYSVKWHYCQEPKRLYPSGSRTREYYSCKHTRTSSTILTSICPKMLARSPQDFYSIYYWNTCPLCQYAFQNEWSLRAWSVSLLF